MRCVQAEMGKHRSLQSTEAVSQSVSDSRNASKQHPLPSARDMHETEQYRRRKESYHICIRVLPEQTA
jgi:hypothetical protein